MNRDIEQAAVREQIKSEVVLAERAHDFAAAWYELLVVFPDMPQVRVTFRRKRGQWLATVGDVNATGTTEADAVRGVVAVLSRRR